MNNPPRKAAISLMTDNAYFMDCFVGYVVNKNQTAMEIWLSMAKEAPEWFNFLMSLRNRIVSCLGLKDLGALGDIISSKQADDYLEGDRVGIFSVFMNEANEVILEDNDKHLNVRLSLYIESEDDVQKVSITTVVHVNNRLGKAYMLFVGPVHKLIVPAILSRLPKV
ncbi:DUF2867 domain-containing protein [Marinomonas sp. BSi20584]|jgi:hypothetical protein|uniref:DUF2867 domain-containing protein n=1 Tax=Marinomonas TaxID=28253 RepID=UPI000C1DF5C3|nr:DUF2867 domain-containing protein [Marinomonas sp. BSi20584]